MRDYILTSESVSEGHPDKIADQVSDAVLDAILDKDKNARVACEVLVKNGMIILAGEINTSVWIDIDKVCRSTINEIGYNSPSLGLDGNSCVVLSLLGKQSSDIALGVDHHKSGEIGAGDQGTMFGYATNETDSYLPAPLAFSHQLMQQQAYVRRNKILPWLRPDAKCQVSVSYYSGQPVLIDTVVLSTQHHPNISRKKLVEGVMEEIIKPILPEHMLNNKTQYLINPTGRFVIGGPVGDCGLTGRKIIVDTYGGIARHGGGCFSGKDPTKVDRSGAYMARYAAKNIVAAGLSEKCEIQVSYAIGISKPISIFVDTFGTENIDVVDIKNIVEEEFDFRPQKIIEKLNLLRPIYKKTACYGHFGRNDPDFTWELYDKANSFKLGESVAIAI